MNLLSILQSIEELLYEIALLIYFIPKTFFKVIIKPSWAIKYISAEWEKDSRDRFQDYMSPILFWVIVGVVPYLILANSFISYISKDISQNTNKLIEIGFIKDISIEIKFICIAIFLITGPLGISIGILVDQKIPINRNNIKRLFYTQCMYWAPVYFFILPCLSIPLIYYSQETANYKYLPLPASIFCWTLSFFSFGWLFFSQIYILKEEFDNIGLIKAFFKFLSYLCVSYGFFIIAEFIIISIFLVLKPV